ncbi:MAG: ComF family protein [Elusimicrobiota bacterium]|nr:ComF family protein [Elusimicrobiota bacterium]
MKISKIINPVLNFFFPDVCIICGEDTDKNNLSVCRKCLNKIEYIKPPYCQTCNQPLAAGGAHCWQCRKTKYHFEKIVAVGKYTAILRELILKFKEKDFLKTALGNLLLEVLTKNIDISQFDLIVAVPLGKKKEFGRDYNQSQLLVEFLADKMNKEVVSGNLVRVKDTKPQFELTRAERLVNLRDAFFVKDPSVFKDKNIVLVDDIATTCSTLEECSTVLKKAGAKKVFCAVLARD